MLNGILIVSLKSGVVLYRRKFVPRFGLDNIVQMYVTGIDGNPTETLIDKPLTEQISTHLSRGAGSSFFVNQTPFIEYFQLNQDIMVTFDSNQSYGLLYVVISNRNANVQLCKLYLKNLNESFLSCNIAPGFESLQYNDKFNRAVKAFLRSLTMKSIESLVNSMKNRSIEFDFLLVLHKTKPFEALKDEETQAAEATGDADDSGKETKSKRSFVRNFFNSIRGKRKPKKEAPVEIEIEEACHDYAYVFSSPYRKELLSPTTSSNKHLYDFLYIYEQYEVESLEKVVDLAVRCDVARGQTVLMHHDEYYFAVYNRNDVLFVVQNTDRYAFAPALAELDLVHANLLRFSMR